MVWLAVIRQSGINSDTFKPGENLMSPSSVMIIHQNHDILTLVKIFSLFGKKKEDFCSCLAEGPEWKSKVSQEKEDFNYKQNSFSSVSQSDETFVTANFCPRANCQFGVVNSNNMWAAARVAGQTGSVLSCHWLPLLVVFKNILQFQKQFHGFSPKFPLWMKFLSELIGAKWHIHEKTELMTSVLSERQSPPF